MSAVSLSPPAPSGPGVEALVAAPGGGAEILSQVERLLSPRYGVVLDWGAVPKDAIEPALPLVWRARLCNYTMRPELPQQQRVASGKGFTLAAAQAGALGEAVERYSAGFYHPGSVSVARAGELPGPMLDPRELVLFGSWQYPELPYAPYAPTSRMGYVCATALNSGDSVWVPALAAYLSYEVQAPEEFLCPVTSNGLACGRSLAEAVLGGLLEVIERDAFTIAWLNRLPAERWEVATHPDGQIRDLAEAYRRRGVELQLVRLLTDAPAAVFLGVATQEDGDPAGPAAVVGLGADCDPAVAARRALLEVAQVRPALRRRLRTAEAQARLRQLVADPRRVAGLEDHDLLYAAAESRPRLAFLLAGSACRTDWPPPVSPDPARDLGLLARGLAEDGSEPLWVDLTPPDMRRLGLFTARVIVPGFQPIDFGWQERRLGGRRLYELPVRLGLRERAPQVNELNADPHPIS